jgi:NAD(P)H-dependent FMN reductase
MAAPKIVAFAGSARTGSYNQTLLAIAADAARLAGAEVTVANFRELVMPLYDGDLEAASGLPENARRFKALLRESDGFLICAPEYNSSITPLLKNAIDWASRTENDAEPELVAYRNKTAALLSASPGALGGMRGLVHLRSILGNIGVFVAPGQICIGAAYEAFDEQGKFKDAGKAERTAKFVQAFVAFTRKMKA